jgi:hypothetical protein
MSGQGNFNQKMVKYAGEWEEKVCTISDVRSTQVIYLVSYIVHRTSDMSY